jgi:hypothetical protein
MLPSRSFGVIVGLSLLTLTSGCWFKANVPTLDEQPLGKGPVKLAFMAEPTGVAAGVVMPAVKIAIQNADAESVADATNSVLVALGGGSPSHVLKGTLSMTPTDGIATFADLQIDVAGSGYTLVATSPDLVSATSARFTVGP